MMAELVEEAIFDALPEWVTDPETAQVYRLSYLMNNVIRVEPRYIDDEPRVFVIGVTVREIR